jgi:hypothetical protein
MGKRCLAAIWVDRLSDYFSNYYGDELTINALIQSDYYPTRFVKEPGME